MPEYFKSKVGKKVEAISPDPSFTVWNTGGAGCLGGEFGVEDGLGVVGLAPKPFFGTLLLIGGLVFAMNN